MSRSDPFCHFCPFVKHLTSLVVLAVLMIPRPSAAQTSWVKVITGGGSSAQGRAVAFDPQGNIVSVGAHVGTVQTDGQTLPGRGGADLFLSKNKPDGTLLWARNFGSTGGEAGVRMAINPADDIYVCGQASGQADLGSGVTSGGVTDLFVAKYSAAGDPLWSRRIHASLAASANDLAVDAAGDLIVTGSFSGDIDLGMGRLFSRFQGQDTFLMKLSGSDGHAQWAQNFSSSSDDGGYAVAVDRERNIFVGGSSLGAVTIGNITVQNLIFIAKLTPGGQPLWASGPSTEKIAATFPANSMWWAPR